MGILERIFSREFHKYCVRELYKEIVWYIHIERWLDIDLKPEKKDGNLIVLAKKKDEGDEKYRIVYSVPMYRVFRQLCDLNLVYESLDISLDKYIIKDDK